MLCPHDPVPERRPDAAFSAGRELPDDLAQGTSESVEATDGHAFPGLVLRGRGSAPELRV